MRIFCFTIFYLLIFNIFSQENNSGFPVYNEDMSYDSILKIIQDKDISFENRYLITGYIEHLTYEQQIEINKSLLQDAKKEKDKKRLLNLYALLCNSYTILYDLNEAKSCLDSAFVYVNQVNDADALAVFYYIAGSFYAMQMEEEKAHECYYKSMDYSEKSQTKKILLTALYYNVAVAYVQREDVDNLRTIMNRMLLFANELEDKNIAFLLSTYTICSAYYEIIYNKNKEEKQWSDSLIMYEKKTIELFDTMKDQLPVDFQYQTAYNYFNLASHLIKIESPDWESISDYVEMGDKYLNPLDTMSLFSSYKLKGLIHFHEKNYKQAEKEFRIALNMLDSSQSVKIDSYYAEIDDYLSKVYEKLGDYITALKYERERANYNIKLHDKDKYETLRNLQIKYETEKKEQEIRQLTEINSYQKKISGLYLGILLLAIIVLIFIILWNRIKRKSIIDRLKITKMEKEEAELKARLNEEQVINAQFEKYDALLEIHFKNVEIKGKEKELEELRKTKQLLDNQISEYSEQFRKYEESKDEIQKADLQNLIAEEIISKLPLLTSKQIVNDYKRKIDDINKDFFIRLQEKAVKQLSSTDMIYALCFAIDMHNQDISLIFDLEPKSIYMSRYRLKHKIGLGKDDDLDLFIRSIST